MSSHRTYRWGQNKWLHYHCQDSIRFSLSLWDIDIWDSFSDSWFIKFVIITVCLLQQVGTFPLCIAVQSCNLLEDGWAFLCLPHLSLVFNDSKVKISSSLSDAWKFASFTGILYIFALSCFFVCTGKFINYVMIRTADFSSLLRGKDKTLNNVRSEEDNSSYFHRIIVPNCLMWILKTHTMDWIELDQIRIKIVWKNDNDE